MRHLDEILNKLEEVKTLVQIAKEAPEPTKPLVYYIYPSKNKEVEYAHKSPPASREYLRFIECPEGSVVISKEKLEAAWDYIPKHSASLPNSHKGNVTFQNLRRELGF